MTKIQKIIAALIFLAAATFEAHHTFYQGKAWEGFTLRSNYISFLYITLWIAASTALFSRSVKMAPVLVFGLFGLLAHSIVISEGGNGVIGTSFMLAGLVAGYCSGRTLFGDMLNDPTRQVHNRSQ